MPIRSELSGLVGWLLPLCMVGVDAYRTRRRYDREYRRKFLTAESDGAGRALKPGFLPLLGLVSAVPTVAACCYVGAWVLVCIALN